MCSVVLVGCTTGTTGAPSADGTTDTTAHAATSATTATTSETTSTLLPGADAVLGIVPPEPTDYPFIEYSYRFNVYQAQCAAAAGYDYEVVGGAAPHLSFNGAVTPRRVEVTERCAEILYERGWVIQNPFDGSAEANAILHDIYVDIYDCMVEHAYPTTEPPSKEAFIEEGESLWTPWEKMYNSVFYADPEGPMLPGDRLQYEAQETCGGSPNEVYDQQLQELQEQG